MANNYEKKRKNAARFLAFIMAFIMFAGVVVYAVILLKGN